MICILLLFAVNLNAKYLNDAQQPNDYIIARAVRQAVRNADQDLLKSTLLSSWRDYLKLAAMDLDINIQPLVLIKFDEDIVFRNRLKKIIEWESDWHKTQTKYYIYYYQWEHPLPELILEVQDVHYKEITQLFSIEIEEKIPYRYDLDADKSQIFAFDDLRGGIISPQPFDLEKAALMIFTNVNSQFKFVTEPLARIYGSYYKNPATAKAYYAKCLTEIKKKGYHSAVDIFQTAEFSEDSPEWYSAYAFMFKLNEKFRPIKITKFLTAVSPEMTKTEFINTFIEVFGISLPDFEQVNDLSQTVNKL